MEWNPGQLPREGGKLGSEEQIHAKNQFQEAIKDLENVQGKNVRWTPPGVSVLPDVKTVGVGIRSDLIQKGKIDFVGQTIRSTDDLAQLIQAYFGLVLDKIGFVKYLSFRAGRGGVARGQLQPTVHEPAFRSFFVQISQ